MRSQQAAPADRDGDRSTSDTLRRVAAAACAGSVLALSCELVLRSALGAVTVVSFGGSTDWMLPMVLSRLVWPIAAGLLWVAAPAVTSRLRSSDLVPAIDATPAAAARVVGVAMVAGPVGWLLASSVVRALAITINDSWATGGRIFIAPEFYSDLVVTYAPWILAGMALVTAAGHLHMGRP
jgi:hypothetical protein